MFDLRIEARDQGSPIRTAQAIARVVIEDLNDNSPIFQNTPYKASISESSLAGTSVITVAATDKDSGPRGQVVYIIKGGNDEGKFAVDRNTGI